MSLFSIPTLRALGHPTLATPTITIEQVTFEDCVPCIPSYNVTITGPAGADLYYNYGLYPYWPDPYCGDNDYSYYSATSPVFLTGIAGAPGTNAVKAIACSGSSSSSVAIDYFAGGGCLTSVDAPIVYLFKQSDVLVTFDVIPTSCGKTYINYGTGVPADPSPSNYMALLDTLTTECVGSTYSGSIIGNDWGKAQPTDYAVKAVTYFDRDGCTVVSSVITYVTECCILE